MADPRFSPSTKKALGVGCGASTLAVVGLVVVLGWIASQLSGCDLDLAIGDPGEGTRSERLAVDVSPRTALAPGQAVHVTSRAFGKDQIVSVTVCLREADTERRGVAACDTVQGYRYATDHRGRLDATYPVPRLVRIGGRVEDCGAAPGRCLVVAASADDFDRSGGRAISFRSGDRPATGPPTVRAASDLLAVVATPSGPVAPGTVLRVGASGFQPGEPLLVAWCTDDALDRGLVDRCEAQDPGAALGALAFRSLPTEGLVADASGRAVVEVPARADVVPTGLGSSSDTSTTAPPARPRPHGHACDLRPGRCAIVIAAAADTKRSAVAPYALTDG